MTDLERRLTHLEGRQPDGPIGLEIVIGPLSEEQEEELRRFEQDGGLLITIGADNPTKQSAAISPGGDGGSP